MSREVLHDGTGALHIRFPFDRRLVDLVKSLPRRRWQAMEKVWWIPDDDVLIVVELLAPEGFTFDDAVRRLYEARGGVRSPIAPLPQKTPIGTFPSSGATGDLTPQDWTVGRLNREVKAALERAFPAPVWLVGEILGFNRNAHKRHVGFTLVERDGGEAQAYQVNAILFEETRRELEKKLAEAGSPFSLEDEVQVRVLVRVDLYEIWGSYRVVIEDLDVLFTLGEAARRREEIVRRLSAAGLLERNSALAFPELPLRVGLITSLNSDAYHDVLRTLGESGFAFQVTAHGARVQGRSTEPSVLNALDWFRMRQGYFDVVLICRGGGSRTDLAWFDSETLGRAVAQFGLPVVVGIGHEQDVSVLDHVARRAKTPTAAAALLVERVAQALDRIEVAGRAVVDSALSLLEEARVARLEAIARLVSASERRIESSRVVLLAGARQLGQAARRDLAAERGRIGAAATALLPRTGRLAGMERERLEARARRLHLVDPRRVVERGYAILRGVDDRVVVGPEQAPVGARVTA
ncbi:MAG TPA: exodeoxyribonuclease VII large subunit, partial [Candidatus Polarisedimenticolaceae bacterium]|nr:exodeoxyribonuclease VII large subunit [Candidatus Polarisedimenticolaceae bacterium]